MKIGFPRALFYYDYFPFWAGFFYRLGIEVVTSPPTNRQIMEDGLKKISDETCLPLKLLAGHIQALKDVDAIFLPRMVSVEADTYNCPKFLGIPESLLPAVPPEIPVLSAVINWRGGQRQVLKDLRKLGLELGKSKQEIRAAFREGQMWQQRYLDSRGTGWNFEQEMREIEHFAGGQRDAVVCSPKLVPESGRDSVLTPLKQISQAKQRLKITLIGHSYLIQEAYANLNLLGRLREKAEIQLVQHVEPNEVEENLTGLRKKLFWNHAKQIYGAGNKFAQDRTIDGIIYLTCFGCGTDSMVQELVARKVRDQHKPYMVITLDEHTGEAGLVTRLEAFLDMVERRKAREGNISAHGECLDRYSSSL
ncbi:acyl-CoA dehydratase activase-related protein [Desulfosporosinus sp. PR]|uniref:acyl-CoA dehydratase activase-related protein n=1 Tax=Candidatus Desulfosporosinus nitrosoreducens TaxID=3401928 RepID=UPI0027F26199|nr:acyl-CoA dehydratase activase-related protein [Desulfosporosinus sp. PR]MDQ7095834.1 acyl-CoA dehydratase activase-related protein [Desulfosporosinus sp. PR]